MKANLAKPLVAGFLGVLVLGIWWAARRSPASPSPPPDRPVEAEPIPPAPLPHAVVTSAVAVDVSRINGQGATASTRDVSPTPQRPAWVDLLLTNGATQIPYAQLVALPISKDALDSLLRRFTELPALPFTNKFGIAQALAYVADERVVDLYQRTLFKDYQGLRLTQADADLITGLVVLMGHLASRYDEALDFLRPGLDEAYWRSNVTWTIEGDSPAGSLVASSIRGLALCGKQEGWDVVLQKRQTASPEYLKRYAGSMVDAAAWWAAIRDHGRDYLAGKKDRAGMDLFVQWASTKEGLEWRRWAARINGTPEP